MSQPSNNARFHWEDLAVVSGTCAAWMFVLWDTPRPPGQIDYYALLSDAYRAGRLSLLIEPSPALLALADPYDPQQRVGIPWLWDASLFEGRYYLYFSPLPALLAYLPFHAITGSYPSGRLVGLTFAVLAMVVNTRTLRLLAPDVRGWPAVAMLAAAATASFLPSHLSTGHVWSVAVLCAHLWTSVFLHASTRIWLDPQGRAWWPVLGVAFGCMVASRPSLLPFALVFAAVSWRVWRIRPHRWRWIGGGVLPVVLMALAMAMHNDGRFGSPFEFGERFLLNSGHMVHGKFCHPLDCETLPHVVNNAPQYLFSLPTISESPPFIGYPRARLLPEDAGLINYPPQEVAGALAFFPFIALGLLALIRPSGADPRFGLARWMTAGALATLLLVSSCAWVVLRYQVDYFPALALPGIVGIVSLEGRNERLFSVGMVLLAVGARTGILLGAIPAG